MQGIQNLVGNKLAVHHAVGCDLVSDDKSGFADAVATAKKSDVVFLFVALPVLHWRAIIAIVLVVKGMI